MCQQNISDTESGYSSDASADSSHHGNNYCPFCDKELSGPRIGLIVHLGRIHTEKTLQQISKFAVANETHRIVKIRNIIIQQKLTVLPTVEK